MSFFVTGTDTGIGKTFVSALLVSALRQKGQEAWPVKPVQTGCKEEDGSLMAPDLTEILQASDLPSDPATHEKFAPRRYRKACSPHLAAELAGSPIEVDALLNDCQKLREEYPLLIFEGAGGIMVPITCDYLMLDLMVELDLPVVLVTRVDLGTINQTLLSVRQLQAAGLEVAAIVFNEPRPVNWSEIETDNLQIVEELSGRPVAGYCRYLPDYDKLIKTPGNLYQKIRNREEYNLEGLGGKVV